MATQRITERFAFSGGRVDREAGTGVVYFSTGNDKPEAGERSAFSRVEEESATGW